MSASLRARESRGVAFPPVGRAVLRRLGRDVDRAVDRAAEDLGEPPEELNPASRLELLADEQEPHVLQQPRLAGPAADADPQPVALAICPERDPARLGVPLQRAEG